MNSRRGVGLLLLASLLPAPWSAAATRTTTAAEEALEAAMRWVALGRLQEGRSLFLRLAEIAGRAEVEQFALMEAARLSLQLRAPRDALRIWETAHARHAIPAFRTRLCREAKATLTGLPDEPTPLRQACFPATPPRPRQADAPIMAEPSPLLDLPVVESALPLAPGAGIRLLLASGQSLAVTLTQTATCRVGGEEILLPPGDWTLREQAGLVYCTNPRDPFGIGAPLGSDLRLDVPARSLRLDGRRYGGAFRLLARPGRLALVLQLDLETYVEGVLLGEMPASWPREALKAQAVAARTYALANLRHASLDWDLVDDARDQRYLPPGPETPGLDAIRTAVQATRSVVLTHAGRLFPAYYHAHSGGTLEPAGASMPGPAEVFRTEKEPAGEGLPVLDWTFSVPAGRVLQAAGCNATSLRGIAVTARTTGGRARTLTLRTPTGACTVEAAALQRALGPQSFKSLLCEVRLEEGTVYIAGKGHGHGVGMSQHGAASLAGQGLKFDAILASYYHESALARLQ